MRTNRASFERLKGAPVRRIARMFFAGAGPVECAVRGQRSRHVAAATTAHRQLRQPLRKDNAITIARTRQVSRIAASANNLIRRQLAKIALLDFASRHDAANADTRGPSRIARLDGRSSVCHDPAIRRDRPAHR